MGKAYQIEGLRAVRRFQQMAAESQVNLQLVLPLVEIVAGMKKGLGELVRAVGLQLVSLLVAEEVRQVVGERSVPQKEREAYRWGQEAGYCRIDGQKVPIAKNRVRDCRGREVRLGSYEMLQRENVPERVWRDLMAGLSTRNYGPTVRRFAEAYGIDKSVVSERFIAASGEKLKDLLERKLDDQRWVVMMIDSTPYHGQQFLVALGIAADGRKRVLGLRQGATENETVANELLEDLRERGVDFRQVRLYVLDGAKALHKAVRRQAGEAAPIQRCQLHKRRNVLRHLPEAYQAEIEQRLIRAWGMFEYTDAKQALAKVRQQLLGLNPSAARSLEEGLEETLTIHRLRVPQPLRPTLFSTNPIESLMSRVAHQCARVKRWRDGNMALRWIASSLLHAERRFHRVDGYREIPQLCQALAVYEAKKPGAKAAKAS